MAIDIKDGDYNLATVDNKDKKEIKEVKDQGVESWTEITYYPESDKTVTKHFRPR